MESSEYDPSCTWEDWEKDMTRYDPKNRGFGQFFAYAASHWVDHFGGSQSANRSRLGKIESLCQAGSIRLDNWIKQNYRPGCAINARFEFESHLYDSISNTSLYGSEAMLRSMIEHSSFDDETMILPTPAFNAAHQILQWGDFSRLKVLFLEDEFSTQLRSLEFFRLIIRQWSHAGVRHDNWNLAFELVDHILGTIVLEQWANELFAVAAGAGCIPMIKHLPDRAHHKTELRNELLRGF